MSKTFTKLRFLLLHLVIASAHALSDPYRFKMLHAKSVARHWRTDSDSGYQIWERTCIKISIPI